jgi:hypothetical protein
MKCNELMKQLRVVMSKRNQKLSKLEREFMNISEEGKESLG